MALMDTGNWLVWQAIRFYLPPGTRLASVYRPPQAQLDFIVSKAKKEGHVFSRVPTLHDPSSWQEALKFIRSKGYKVAAPGTSMHQRGLAYDLSGPDLDAIVATVRKAVAHRRIRLVSGSKSSLLKEPKNACVHVEIDAALLDFEPFEYA